MLTTAQIIARLLIITILSGLLGLERESKHKPAGLRTNILVGLGSTLAMLTSIWFEMDPARIAAGVITGIGFLGAGLILKDKEDVHGITTAATIWIVSAVGLAVGIGYYIAAVTATIISLLVLFVFGSDNLRKFFGLNNGK